MKKTQAAALALIAVLVQGCSGMTPLGKPVNRLPAYKKDDAARYGDWLIEPNTCRLDGNSTDVHVSTDGTFSGNTIELRLAFAMPLVRPPRATVSSYPVALPLEGANRTYNIQLAYDPTTAAHFMAPDTFLTIRYQPLNEPQAREINLATRGLVHGLAAMARLCNQQN